MMLVLTVVTGVVDAASYLRLGHVFVANMTGNVVFIGFAIAGARGLSASASLLALAAFLLGASLGGLLGAHYGEHRGHVLRAAGALQAGLLALGVIVALAVAEPISSGARYALLAPLALAMGVQNAAAQRLSVPELHDHRADAHADRDRLGIRAYRWPGIETRPARARRVGDAARGARRRPARPARLDHSRDRLGARAGIGCCAGRAPALGLGRGVDARLTRALYLTTSLPSMPAILWPGTEQ